MLCYTSTLVISIFVCRCENLLIYRDYRFMAESKNCTFYLCEIAFVSSSLFMKWRSDQRIWHHNTRTIAVLRILSCNLSSLIILAKLVSHVPNFDAYQNQTKCTANLELPIWETHVKFQENFLKIHAWKRTIHVHKLNIFTCEKSTKCTPKSFPKIPTIWHWCWLCVALYLNAWEIKCNILFVHLEMKRLFYRT